MDFNLFKDNYNQLLGVEVCVTSSQGYRAIKKIVKVTGTGFRVEGELDKLFSFQGTEKGGQGDKWSSISKSHCELLSPVEATALREEFLITNRSRKIREHITTNLNKFTYDQLLAIFEIIKPT